MRQRKPVKRFLINLSLVLIFVYFSFPLFWMIWTSIKPRIYAYQPGKWLFVPTFQGYISVLNQHRINTLFWNSLIISLIATAVALFVGTLAVYGLIRFESRHNRKITLFFLNCTLYPAHFADHTAVLLGKNVRHPGQQTVFDSGIPDPVHHVYSVDDERVPQEYSFGVRGGSDARGVFASQSVLLGYDSVNQERLVCDRHFSVSVHMEGV